MGKLWRRSWSDGLGDQRGKKRGNIDNQVVKKQKNFKTQFRETVFEEVRPVESVQECWDEILRRR